MSDLKKDADLKVFIKQILFGSEGAKDKQYQLSFAEKGNSGATFGLTQNDIATNNDAKNAFRTILTDYTVNGARVFSNNEVTNIVNAAATNGLAKSEFVRQIGGAIVSDKITLALNSARDKIDGLDNSTLASLTKRTRDFLEAVQDNPNGAGVYDYGDIDPKALGLAVAWMNMSGRGNPNLPETITQYFSGSNKAFFNGKAQRLDATPSLTDLYYYLRNQTYFVSYKPVFNKFVTRTENAGLNTTYAKTNFTDSTTDFTDSTTNDFTLIDTGTYQVLGLGNWLYSNGQLYDLSDTSDALIVDNVLSQGWMKGFLDSEKYLSFSQTISQTLTQGSLTFNQSNAPADMLNPIGAFYEAKSAALDIAASIASKTPVLMNILKQGLSANALQVLDANQDGKLSGAELNGLQVWIDANEDGIGEASEFRTLAQAGIQEIRSTDYGFVTRGNSKYTSGPVAVPVKGSDTIGQPGSVIVAPAVPSSNYRTLRNTDNVFRTRYGNIFWSAKQIKINYNNQTYLIGTDGKDSFNANYYAAYSQYFNSNLLVNFLAGGGDDVVGGSARNDTLWGGLGDDYLDGGDGVDLVFGGQGVDTAFGGTGNDTIYVGESAKTWRTGKSPLLPCSPISGVMNIALRMAA